MKLFKSIDDKFEEIGFEKIQDNGYAVEYQRYNTEHDFTHVITILHKANGKHLIQSYDRNLFDAECIGCTNVGLSYYETKLALKKMKQKGWKSK